MYVPCRHHILEIILKEVFFVKVLDSTTCGPTIPLIERFKKEFASLKYDRYATGISEAKKIMSVDQI